VEGGKVRSLFDIPDDIAYFNCASITPLLRAAREAIARSVDVHAQPWRLQSAAWFESVETRRALFADLVGLDRDGVAVAPSTSYGLAVAINTLTARPGQRVLIPASEFPSDVFAWRRFCSNTGAELTTVSRDAEATWTDAITTKLDERVAVVAVPYVHWMDGASFDLVRISQCARAVGAALVIDASQSLGVLSHDLARVAPDFLVSVGYKWLLGPFGLSYLYAAPEHRRGPPLEESWMSREGAEDFARLTEYQERYRAGARRFDAGQSAALELNQAACVGLEQLKSWGVATVAEKLRSVTARVEESARRLGFVVTSGPSRGPHVLGVRMPAGAMSMAASVFAARKVFVGARGDVIRISPHMHTTEADVDRLIDALAALAASRSRGA
jgi:selenocysteine lyase/cysteine desulfurase